MATITKFEDLEIWQLARTLSKKVYALTTKEPLALDFRLKDQMRGSSGSIMDNIAEGFERGSRFEFINSLSISKGETGELKSQLYRSFDNAYISEAIFNELYQDADILTKKTTNFILYLNSTKFKGQKFKNRDRK
ncbi:four helix bundle protein [Niastella populi]|uniref:Four helix bundle protein n=1 Tax=Niastella populi TaxID=550983 RepID=A0A1V9FDP2_9BACT|nr:four helix bundle protein [Niastella populi]OQP56483.1 four helix bundle protein [Niastella populi]